LVFYFLFVILLFFPLHKYSVGLDPKEKPKYIAFDCTQASETPYPITKYQPVYYVADSFASAKEKITEYTQNMKRRFTLRYNPFTQSVDILDHPKKVAAVLKQLQTDLSSIQGALNTFDGIQ
jgi:phenylalanine-4-hydroxylase